MTDMKLRKPRTHSTGIGQAQIYAILVCVMMLPNLILCFSETGNIGFFFIYLLLPLALYMGCLLLLHKPGITFWCLLPFHFISAFQLVLIYLYGRSILASDMFLNMLTTNSNEASELLINLLIPLIGVSLIYIPALALSSYSWQLSASLTSRFRKRAGILAILLLGISALLYPAAHERNPARYSIGNIYPFNAYDNVRFALRSWYRSKTHPQSSENFSFGAVSSHAPDEQECYVLVIGETSRANNWQLYGYKRETNPGLTGQSGLLRYSDVTTQVNTTHKSVPLILSAASAEQFEAIYRQKSLITAFREAGFYTVFLSNQQHNGSFTDHFATEADSTLYLRVRHPDRKTSDREFLPIVASALNRRHDKIVWILHTYGSHFKYNERYDDDDRIFLPDRIDGIDPQNREGLLNAYDNSIRATDRLLSDLIQAIGQTGRSTALLYLSDHGEDILDDSRGRFLHASPTPSYYQLHIPFLIWLSPEYRERHPVESELCRLRQRTPFDSRTVFHTLLGIAGIRTPYADARFDLSHPCFAPGERFYLGEHNRPIRLSHLSFDPQDFAQIYGHRLSLQNEGTPQSSDKKNGTPNIRSAAMANRFPADQYVSISLPFSVINNMFSH